MGNYPSQPPAGDYSYYYLNYTIYFRNKSELQANIATYGNFMVNRSPAYMRDALGINETAFGWQVDNASLAISFPYPPTAVFRDGTGAWEPKREIQGTIGFPPNSAFPGDPYWWPPLGNVYDYDEDWFIVPGYASIPIFGPGKPLLFIWTAMLLQMGGSQQLAPAETPPAASPGTPSPPGPGGTPPNGGMGSPGVPYNPIMPIRWGMGFEINSGVSRTPEGLSGEVSHYLSTDASRVPGGLGLAIRSLTGLIGDVAVNVNRTVTNAELSWERYYIRIRSLPTTGATNGVQIIGYVDSSSSQVANIRITSTGELSIWMALGGGAPAAVATGAVLVVGQWYCIDVFLGFDEDALNPGKTTAGMVIYANRTLYTSGSQVVENILGVTLATTRLGNGITGANDLEYDLDDCFNADAPDFLSGPDFNSGTHFTWIKALSVDSAGDWVGQFQVVNQIIGGTEVTELLVSSTAVEKYKFNTLLNDLPEGFQQFIIQQGIISFQICGVINNATTQTNGAIGYDVNGGGNVLKTVQFEIPGRGVRILDNFSEGENMPLPIDSLSGVIEHSNDTHVNQITQAGALVETIGSWGPEDDDEAFSRGITDVIGIHNGPFIATLMSYQSTPPIDEVAVETGTYTGNGTIKTFSVNMLAVHWLYIRRISGSSTSGGNVFWFSSMIGAHKTLSGSEYGPNEMVSVQANTDGTTTITIFGSSASQNNNSGDIYEYIAVCDITSKLMLNGSFAHASSMATAINDFFVDDFLPVFAFLMPEYVDAAVSASVDTYLKGPANSANSGTASNDIVETANVATFGTGSITSRANLHNINQSQAAYSVWRSVVSADFPLPLYVGSYTGNGTGARTLTVDLGARRPLFAIIYPKSGAIIAQYRDPGHTGTNSGSLHSNGNTTNSIVGGGIDQILIGTNLNVNLVEYNVFAIPGGTDACNNGWSCDGTYILIPPGLDPPDHYLIPPGQPADIAVAGSGGIVLSGEPPTLLVADLSGVYEIVPRQRHDTILTRAGTPTAELDVAIPEPFGKTGYIGG